MHLCVCIECVLLLMYVRALCAYACANREGDLCVCIECVLSEGISRIYVCADREGETHRRREKERERIREERARA